jgi:hypothetical protein
VAVRHTYVIWRKEYEKKKVKKGQKCERKERGDIKRQLCKRGQNKGKMDA